MGAAVCLLSDDTMSEVHAAHGVCATRYPHPIIIMYVENVLPSSQLSRVHTVSLMENRGDLLFKYRHRLLVSIDT